MAEKLGQKLPATVLRQLLVYALADMFGMFCFGLGLAWFLPLFSGARIALGVGPNSLAEAVAFLAGGLAVMAWAMLRLLHAINRTGPQGSDPAG